MSLTVSLFGTPFGIRKFFDNRFVSEIRYTDHDSVDISDISRSKGDFMYKADRVNIYVF